MVSRQLYIMLSSYVIYASAFTTPQTSHSSSIYHDVKLRNSVLLYSAPPDEKIKSAFVNSSSETANELDDKFDISEEFLRSAISDQGSDVIVGKTTTEENSVVSGLLWRGVVVALCAFWASNFPVAKLIMAEPGVDSSLYALSRFGLAALALAPGAFLAARRGAIDAETARAAAVCGGWVTFGYLGQTLGLLTTTASRSCIICTLHCVFVAAVAEGVRVARSNSSFDYKRLLPALVAVLGVVIVELRGAAGAPTIGDALSFAQPIGFGLGYLQLEELMRKRPEAALPVSAIKLMVVATASFVMYELLPLINTGLSDGLANWSPRLPDFSAITSSPVALGGIMYTGIVTTALALWVESIAFKRVPATDASIILTTEPLFAAGTAAVTLGETFGVSDYVGASLIIGACVLAVLLEDEAADKMCDVDADPSAACEPPRTWPFAE